MSFEPKRKYPHWNHLVILTTLVACIPSAAFGQIVVEKDEFDDSYVIYDKSVDYYESGFGIRPLIFADSPSSQAPRLMIEVFVTHDKLMLDKTFIIRIDDEYYRFDLYPESGDDIREKQDVISLGSILYRYYIRETDNNNINRKNETMIREFIRHGKAVVRVYNRKGESLLTGVCEGKQVESARRVLEKYDDMQTVRFKEK